MQKNDVTLGFAIEVRIEFYMVDVYVEGNQRRLLSIQLESLRTSCAEYIITGWSTARKILG